MNEENQQLTKLLLDNMNRVVLGKQEVVLLSVVALLGEGHLLIEDAPGVGKTSLAKALAKSINSDFKRLQFTPDMLPSDIIGTTIYRQNTGEFEFRPGPIFTHVLLADEINRTTPRTQSALLEAMSEQQVSVDGITHPLKKPFFVLATQNPFEFEGTYPLPENQLDRFMLRIEIGYPARDVEKDVLTTHSQGEPVDNLKSVLTIDQVRYLQQTARGVRVDESIKSYMMDIITATRKHEELSLGVSTRGGITLFHAVQAYAMLKGRDYAVPDDVKHLAIPALSHRVVLKGVMREGQRDRSKAIIQQILSRLSVPH